MPYDPDDCRPVNEATKLEIAFFIVSLIAALAVAIGIGVSIAHGITSLLTADTACFTNEALTATATRVTEVACPETAATSTVSELK